MGDQVRRIITKSAATPTSVLKLSTHLYKPSIRPFNTIYGTTTVVEQEGSHTQPWWIRESIARKRLQARCWPERPPRVLSLLPWHHTGIFCWWISSLIENFNPETRVKKTALGIRKFNRTRMIPKAIPSGLMSVELPVSARGKKLHPHHQWWNEKRRTIIDLR